MRGLVIVAVLAAGAFIALIAALWLAPGNVFRWGASFASRAGITVTLPNVSGNPAGGWLFDRPAVEAAGYSVSMRRLFVDIDWSELGRGRPALDALWIDGLFVDVHPVAGAAPVADARKSDRPVSLPAVHDLRVTDGRFALRQSDSSAIDVRRIALESEIFPTGISVSRLSARAYGNDIGGNGRYDIVTKSGFADLAIPDCLRYPGVDVLERYCLLHTRARVSVNGNRISLERFSTFVEGSSVTAAGKFNVAPFSGNFHLGSSGPFVITVDAKGDAAAWNVSGEARRDGHALTFSGGVHLAGTPAYVFNVQASGIPAGVVPGLPPGMGHLSGHLTGAVQGKSPATLSGQSSFHLTSTVGPTLNGSVILASGLANADVIVSSGGLKGKVTARWDLGRQQGQAAADLSVDGKELKPWTGVAADGRVRASLSGRMPGVVWKMDADLKKIDVAGTTIDKMSFSGRGERLSPPQGSVVLEVSGLKRGSQRVDVAKISAEGSLARHSVKVSVASEGRIVDGTATGSLSGSEWRSTWREFVLTLGDKWTVRQPFDLTAGPAGGTVRGLRLASGDSRLDVDGGVLKGRFQDLRIHSESVAIAPLVKALKVPMDVSGQLTMTAAIMGTTSAPEGNMTGSVASLAVNGKSAGALNVSTRLLGQRLYLDAVHLEGPAGILDATGSVPISFSGRNAPPIQIRVRTEGLDPAAIPLPEGIHFEKARIDGDLTVKASHGEFSADGRLAFVAGSAVFDDVGVSLSDVDIRLAADGQDLKIVKAVARTGKGTIALDGTVTAHDAAVSLRARGFEMKHPMGIFIRTDGDLALSGPWDSPRVTGTVDVLKADINPGRAKKPKKGKEAAAPEPAPVKTNGDAASPLAADVRIVFNNNVWYKDGQSAIEFRGNLNARKAPGEDAQLFGTIETIRGEYIFYGRAFKFEQGQLTFVGNSPPDPTLDVLATYVTDQNNVKIHLAAKGPLSRPELSLTSEPPMEETDIVSVLVTGAPRGQGTGGASNEAAARLMAANFLAEKLRSKLQSRVPIDQLKFKLTDQGAAEVTVGQNVTDDLYVSYASTLGAAGERRVNAEYILTPRWSLNGQTSSIGKYVIDLLFKYGFH